MKLRIDPTGEQIEMGPGESVRDALVRVGLEPQTPCNGSGLCGQCRVLVKGPSVPETPHPRIPAREAAAGVRLACKLVPREGMTIRPLAQAQDRDAEADTAQRLLGAELRGIPTARAVRGESVPLGLAIDLGTTTLVATLISLRSGAELCTRAIVNPQVQFGHDVITRIEMGSRPAGLHTLSAAARQGMNRLAQLTCKAVEQRPDAITEVVLGGNTTMLQLAAGIDPAPLGHLPFAVGIEGGSLHAADHFGLELHPRCRVYVPPVLHAFAGSDVSAGLLVAGDFFEQTAATLFLDVGTNGEVALSANGTQVATSTAAGPAFEGMGLTCGMIARPGAVEAAWVADGALQVQTVDGARAEGICGSGVVDLVAALYRLGVLQQTGRMLSHAERSALPPALADRVEELDEQPAFRVAPNVYLTQQDVREVQLAKAAVCTAVEMLLEEVEVTHLDKTVLAEGFGQTLRPSSMKTIGMLPPQLGRQITRAGNTSRQGCVSLLQRQERRQQLEERMNSVTHLMLAERPDYMDRYVGNMELPSLPG